MHINIPYWVVNPAQYLRFCDIVPVLESTKHSQLELAFQILIWSGDIKSLHQTDVGNEANFHMETGVKVNFF